MDPRRAQIDTYGDDLATGAERSPAAADHGTGADHGPSPEPQSMPRTAFTPAAGIEPVSVGDGGPAMGSGLGRDGARDGGRDVVRGAATAAGAGLDVSNVTHAYGTTTVLVGVSFSAKPGEITCLLGASGEGKSTLLQVIAGHERVQSGVIGLDGAVLASRQDHPRPEHRPVGLVFQDTALFPHMTVLANVAFGLKGMGRGEKHAQARDALARVGLAAFADRYPHELSGGQAQRVALMRALAPAPRVVLLDEPYANADPALRQALREQARDTLKTSGAVTILVTHDPDEAMEMADSIAVLANGTIVQQDTPERLYRQPAHKAVCAALGGGQMMRGRVVNTQLHTPCGPIELLQRPCPTLQGREVEAVLRADSLAVKPDCHGPAVCAPAPGSGSDACSGASGDNHGEPVGEERAPWMVRELRFNQGQRVAMLAARLCEHTGPCVRVLVDDASVVPGQPVHLRQSGPGVFLFAP